MKCENFCGKNEGKWGEGERYQENKGIEILRGRVIVFARERWSTRDNSENEEEDAKFEEVRRRVKLYSVMENNFRVCVETKKYLSVPNE
jgi:hypothetical protein